VIPETVFEQHMREWRRLNPPETPLQQHLRERREHYAVVQRYRECRLAAEARAHEAALPAAQTPKRKASGANLESPKKGFKHHRHDDSNPPTSTDGDSWREPIHVNCHAYG
jgi:hypothetical protein